MPSLNPPRALNSDEMSGGDAQRTTFWQQFFGLPNAGKEAKETGPDGPALGEI